VKIYESKRFLFEFICEIIGSLLTLVKLGYTSEPGKPVLSQSLPRD
jgi:hypothetical protein